MDSGAASHCGLQGSGHLKATDGRRRREEERGGRGVEERRREKK